MTDQAIPTDWFFREGGVVTQTAHDVSDPTRFHLENGLARQIGGEPLSEPERAAVDTFTAKGDPLSLGAFNSADARLAALAAIRPDVLQALDRFTSEMAADAGGFGEMIAWQVLGDYCDRAQGVAASELGLASEDDGTDCLAPPGEHIASAADDGPEGWSTVPSGRAR